MEDPTTSLFLLCPQEIPQQMNGSDCGMFTCKYADYITKDKPITFTQVITNKYLSSKCHCSSLKMSYVTSLLFTETHALLQEKDGLGDSEPQAVVILAWLWTCIVSSLREEHESQRWLSYIKQQDPLTDILLWERLAHQLMRSGTSSATLHPLMSIKPSADCSWRDVAGAPSTASRSSTPLCCFLVHPWSISKAAEMLRVLNRPARTVLTYKPYSELQCSAWCRHTKFTCFCLTGMWLHNAASFL